MLPSLWLLVGSDRPTDQGTDRQCQLLSCPGQLKITREKILNKQCLPVVENALKHVCQTFCSTLGSFALSNNSVKYFLRFYFLNTMQWLCHEIIISWQRPVKPMVQVKSDSIWISWTSYVAKPRPSTMFKCNVPWCFVHAVQMSTCPAQNLCRNS